MGDRTPNGAAMTHLRISDLAGDAGEERHVVLQDVADLEVAVPGQGADGHVTIVLPDV